MTKDKIWVLWIGTLGLSLSVAHAQSPQEIIQQVVDTEYAANQSDDSQWIYLEEIQKPKEHVLQWVASTPQGDVQRVLERNEESVSGAEQRDLIQAFLHDTRAQTKQIAESHHDYKQVDDLLKLLPVAFLWTQTGATATVTSLHFEPNPNFHPPTREARIFASMVGDLVADNQQHRIVSMRGHLIHEVAFGGGILGKLKEGGSFSLEQEQVGKSLWQLTGFQIHIEGNALLFKRISLLQEDNRSEFQPEPLAVTLDQAATAIMKQPETVQARTEPKRNAEQLGPP
jgi:hypothetical protein